MPNNNATNYQTTQYNVLVGSSSNTISNIAPPATEQLLISQGAAANPAFGSSTTANFSFGAPSAGITKTLTVSNTSNTSNSKARKVISVAGTSAGDPQTTWGNVTNWSEGIDNSDSDAYVVSQSATLGTNNIMRITTTGLINYPLQPCFSAYNSAIDNDVTGDGTLYTVICDTEIKDQNNDYNNTTGIFTAPVTGRYCFWGNVQLSDLDASTTTFYLQFTSSNRNYFPQNSNASTMRDAANKLSVSACIIVDMDSGDTCKMEVYVSGSTKTVDLVGDNTTVYTSFMGKLYA